MSLLHSSQWPKAVTGLHLTSKEPEVAPYLVPTKRKTKIIVNSLMSIGTTIKIRTVPGGKGLV